MRRFSRWSQKGIWWRMFAAMSDDPDFEYLIVDSTIIRAHQHAAGTKKGLKIRPLAVLVAVCARRSKCFVRGLGFPVRFTLTAGQKGDAPQADAKQMRYPASASVNVLRRKGQTSAYIQMLTSLHLAAAAEGTAHSLTLTGE